MNEAREDLGPLAEDVEAALERLVAADAVDRIWARDHTFWQDEPREVADRLGWLDVPAEMLDRTGELESFAVGLVSSGFTHAVVMGMGGSSLFPEVAARTFGDGAGALELQVLDTTDPAAVLRIRDTVPIESTLFLAASKSGTTVETRSHLAYFWDVVGRPEQFAVVTDPGTPLAAVARDRSFRAVFENRPDIGGRYSAMSHFGLVPAALCGAEVSELVHTCLDMADACRAPEIENPGVRLGAVLAAAALAGHDKLTLSFDPAFEPFGAWVEQLVAESTGKNGTGLLPIDGEPLRDDAAYGNDRLFVGVGSGHVHRLTESRHPLVHVPCEDPYDLGAEAFRWEMATAVAGHLLGVNPFDQPDVEGAKDATQRALARGDGVHVDVSPFEPVLDAVAPTGYLAVQAYVDPGDQLAGLLRDATFRLGEGLGIAATFGLGPRYLHSTGQYHKGGPPIGVFVQVVSDDPRDVEIPGAGYTFGDLKHAQAAGDFAALSGRGLPVVRVRADDLLGMGA